MHFTTGNINNSTPQFFNVSFKKSFCALVGYGFNTIHHFTSEPGN